MGESMQQQADDLRAEGEELRALLTDLSADDWSRPTPFKSWTVNDVVNHLHSGDWMAVQSLSNPEGFRELARAVHRGTSSDKPYQGSGPELLQHWHDYFEQMCNLLAASDPKRRCPWFGPDMGVRMFATARQMETWAHGHDIYDLLGRQRVYTDRLKHIAEIGVRTFGWTFVNRKQEPPGPAPHVVLTAPSGVEWAWNAANDESCVRGTAVDFCHVVTQGRNVADTQLEVIGSVAQQWMAIAQCFAGPPEDPPAPGSRT